MTSTTIPLWLQRSAVFARWRRLPAASKLAGTVVVIYVFIALFGPWLAPYSATDFNLGEALQPPSAVHPFGTDGFGRDVFSRVIIGARSILTLSAAATIIGVGIGGAWGLISGYLGGIVDEILMRVVDVLLALPGLLLAMLILTSLGPSEPNLVISIAAVFVPKSARVIRGAVLPIRTLGYVEAARLRGSSWLSIAFREILPNVADELAVETCLRFAYALLLISSLGFLGFGVQPPAPDWGLMINEARNFVTIAPWMLAFPALAIGTAVVAVTILADGAMAKGSHRATRYL